MRSASMMLYGIVAYLCFAATFGYMAGFVSDLPWPTNIDEGPGIPAWQAVPIDAMLLSLFAIQHSVMARSGFKRWWTRIVPQRLERSTFVLAASAMLAVLLWQWKPIPQPVIWHVQHPAGVMILEVLFFMGWGVLLVASFLLDHFELFGLRQSFGHAEDGQAGATQFRTPSLYRFVRHPIYFGLLVSFWSTPRMSAGHLLFSIGMTVYVFVGIVFEERDLVAQFGERYRAYRRQVHMILPLPRSR